MSRYFKKLRFWNHFLRRITVSENSSGRWVARDPHRGYDCNSGFGKLPEITLIDVFEFTFPLKGRRHFQFEGTIPLEARVTHWELRAWKSGLTDFFSWINSDRPTQKIFQNKKVRFWVVFCAEGAFLENFLRNFGKLRNLERGFENFFCKVDTLRFFFWHSSWIAKKKGFLNVEFC